MVNVMKRADRTMIMVECQQLIKRVANLTDAEKWDDLVKCYAEDAMLYRPSDPNTAIKGHAALLVSFKARPPRTSAHLIGNSDFDIVTEDKVNCNSKVWLVPAPATE